MKLLKNKLVVYKINHVSRKRHFDMYMYNINHESELNMKIKIK